MERAATKEVTVLCTMVKTLECKFSLRGENFSVFCHFLYSLGIELCLSQSRHLVNIS